MIPSSQKQKITPVPVLSAHDMPPYPELELGGVVSTCDCVIPLEPSTEAFTVALTEDSSLSTRAVSPMAFSWVINLWTSTPRPSLSPRLYNKVGKSGY